MIGTVHKNDSGWFITADSGDTFPLGDNDALLLSSIEKSIENLRSIDDDMSWHMKYKHVIFELKGDKSLMTYAQIKERISEEDFREHMLDRILDEKVHR